MDLLALVCKERLAELLGVVYLFLQPHESRDI
jgi:hypothetical protein